MDEPTAEAMSLTVSVCAGLKQFIGDMGTTHRPIAVWAPAHRSLGVSLPVPADLCRRVPCSDEGRGVAGRSRLRHEGRKLFYCRAGTCAHLLTSSRACGREQSVAMGMQLGGRERPQVQHDTLCSARHRYRCDDHFGR